MAARTDWAGVKTQVTPDQISFRLEPSVFVRVRDSVLSLRLQKWRVVGDGRTTKEQIRDYVTRCREFSTSCRSSSHSEEGLENADVPTSLPAKEFHPSGSPVPTVEEEASLEDRGQSSSVTQSMVEEGEAMLAKSPPDGEAVPSSGSEFTNADGYISGQEEESDSEEEELNGDSDELTTKEAHYFKIFRLDDEEKREPASILDLDFECKRNQPGNVQLHIMGYCSSDSSGLFMRTIDSWSMKQDGERKMGLYVRDIKGVWIKLMKPVKGYEVSVRGTRLLSRFLEIAMTSKESDPWKCLDQLEKIWSRDEIKTVLLKYHASVVEKVVESTKEPKFSRMTAIIKNMGSLLRGKLKKESSEKGKPVVSVKRASASDEMKSENNLTVGVQSLGNKRRRIEELDPEYFSEKLGHKEKKNTDSSVPASNKRKRLVESDSEDESGSEDHVPLSQRQFQLSGRPNKSVPSDELVENIVKRNESDTDFESRKHDLDSDVAGLRLSHAVNKNETSPRWDELGLDHEGEEEYQDIADAYGGQSDGLGEIVDDENEELGDSAFCAICDDGGDLLLCDGPCMRSFHASKESSARSESKCRSLGLDPEKVREMGSWKCENCVHGEHQCFICGQLGRSEGEEKEVYICDVALCGRFYHPGCLAKWKKEEKFNSIMDEDAFIRGVKAGVGEFCCPAHKCRRCGEGEEEGGDDNSMKLAKCRRCPKAYHKVCLPKSISFENEPIRAWEIGDEDDTMKRLVIYCLTHEIVEHLSTPKRNHLKWPKLSSSPEIIRHKDSLDVMRRLTQLTHKQQKFPKTVPTRQIPVNEEDDGVVYGNYWKDAKVNSSRKVSYEELNLAERHAWVKPETDLDFSAAGGRDRSTSHMLKRDVPVVASTPLASPPKPVNLPKMNDLQKRKATVRLTATSFPTSTEGREERVQDIMRRASQKVTLETVKENLAQPSCYGENKKKNFLHLGELQSMVNAIQKAAEKVKNGGSWEDAKRLCPKDYFLRFLKNEDMLKVHLAPILHGMRYTSFGRHFTCIDKLKEIVNRIHPYIESGDMIVDFCCGANDFSIILNEKLLSTGKACQFMNFDIHPPKNDFCFTKGDWLINQGLGFLEGKKLVMGLNPPFGVRAALANRFIIHALKFKPKLLVLIVPPETMSFSKDYNDFGYDLVWEDKELLKGHAFYLPGSVDENDGENRTQWNVIPPPLYLWSSRDMVQKHRDIALRCKHVDILKVDPLVLPLPVRRTPTPTPPARDVSRLPTPSDKWTNSGSTTTENDCSSSRLQRSSATSSGHSQNSFDGSGHCLSAGGQHPAGWNPSLGRQTSGEQAPDQQHMPFMRTGFGPGAGPPPNHLLVLPHQQLTQNLAPGAQPSHSGPTYGKRHGQVPLAELIAKHGSANLNQSSSELISKHGNPNANQSAGELIGKHGNVNPGQSSPREKQAQWGPVVERPGQYHHDGIDRQHSGPLISPRPVNLPAVQPPWPGFGPGPNLHFNHGFQHRLPNPHMWPPPPLPPPHPFLGIGLGPRHPFPPVQDHFLRGPPPPFDRRPRGHHNDVFKESGGWLE